MLLSLINQKLLDVLTENAVFGKVECTLINAALGLAFFILLRELLNLQMIIQMARLTFYKNRF